MSYNGQRGPAVNVNMSDFIGSLNTIETPHDTNDFNAYLNDDANLDMFTTTQFWDYDQGQNTDVQAANFLDLNVQGNSESKALDFVGEADFQFGQEFSFPQQPPAGYAAPIAPTQTAQPIYPASSGTASPQNGLSSPHTGEKRKSASIAETPYPANYDEDSRVAAEEDKRRRNTAASARFRVKKKQREQALEKSAKEMADKVSALENKINRLETENKWLKSLVLEKKDNQGEKEIADMFKKFQEDADRKASERKDGVGTVSSEA